MGKRAIAVVSVIVFALFVIATIGSAMAAIWLHSYEWTQTGTVFFFVSLFFSPVAMGAVLYAQA